MNPLESLTKEQRKEHQKQRLELWERTEKEIVKSHNPEDLRTSGLISVESSDWMRGAVRLEEALQWGIHDLQVLDYFGEAAYRAEIPQIMIPFEHYYADPKVAVHMARAYTLLGEKEKAHYFLTFAEDNLLKEALRVYLSIDGSFENSKNNLLKDFKHNNDRLSFVEFWQALAVFAEAAGDEKKLQLAERKLNAYAFKSPTPHYNQALRYLKTGELSAGWKLYEWRLHPKSGCPSPTRLADLPMWEGERLNPPLQSPSYPSFQSAQNEKKSHLLILLELGWGDQIFSLRYARELLKKDIQISFAVHASLKDLVQASFPNCTVYDLEDFKEKKNWPSHLPRPDFWCYALSIPARAYIFDYAGRKGFLDLDKQNYSKESLTLKKMNPSNLPIVGITWHGDISSPFKKSRAYSLTEFIQQTRLFDSPKLVVCLQKDLTEQEKIFLKFQCELHQCPFFDASVELVDFFQTAKWLKTLTHFYGCDTAITHLAGALSVPTTALIRNTSIWQWQPREASAPGDANAGAAAGGKADAAGGIRVGAVPASDVVSSWYDSVQLRHALVPKYCYMFDLA